MKQYALNSMYIKDYDEKTFNRIVKLHKDESFRLKLLKKFRRKLFEKYIAQNLCPIDSNYQIGIVSNVLKFASLDYDDYLRYTFRDKNIERMTSQSETDAFWYNNIKEKWLCMNLALQLRDYTNVFNALADIIDENSETLSLCDYGCGSAALSMALNNKYHFKKMDLYDIDNYVAKFVQYSIKENNLVNTDWYDIINEKVDKQYDFVLSLDVLEHVEKSYEMLKKLIEKTKRGGYLVLKIAFECNDPTHLPQAAKNFFIDNDGIKLLHDNFKQIKRFDRTNIVNGIYQKI